VTMRSTGPNTEAVPLQEVIDFRSSLVQSGLVFTFLATFLPTPLFTLAGASEAQMLVLDKIFGDAAGCISGIWHCSCCTDAGNVSACTQISCSIVVGIRLIISACLVAWLIGVHSSKSSQFHWGIHVGMTVFFFVGQHVACILDLVPQLLVNGAGGRGSVARRSLIFQFAGSFFGTLCGIPVLLTLQ